MRARIWAVVGTAVLIAGCSSGGGSDDGPTAPPGAQVQASTAAPGTPAPALLQLGQPATTAGDTTTRGGTLELTPTTVVYRTGTEAGTVPSRDGYVTVVIQHRNAGAVPADLVGNISGGWRYIAPDGEAITQGVSVPGTFKYVGGRIQPGTFQWGAQSWDIRNDQRGGVVEYTDGVGVVHRWQLPPQDSGPQVAEARAGRTTAGARDNEA